jgi:hypothetical protein
LNRAIQQVAELLSVPGIDIVAPLPGDLPKINVYVAGVPANTNVPGAAKALVTFLTSEAAATVLKQKGMDPLLFVDGAITAATNSRSRQYHPASPPPLIRPN